MKSMAPGWCQNGHIVEMYLIFENLLIYSYMTLRKTKCMVMVSMKPFTKSMKSMAFRCWVQTLRWGQYDHIVKMYLILVTYMYHYILIWKRNLKSLTLKTLINVRETLINVRETHGWLSLFRC